VLQFFDLLPEEGRLKGNEHLKTDRLFSDFDLSRFGRRPKFWWGALTSVFIVLAFFLFTRDLQSLLAGRSEVLYQTSQLLAQLLPAEDLTFAGVAKNENESVFGRLNDRLIQAREDLNLKGELLIVQRAGDEYRFVAGTQPERRLGDSVILGDPLEKAVKGLRYGSEFDWEGSRSKFMTVAPLKAENLFLVMRSQESALFFQVAGLLLHYFVLMGGLTLLFVAWNLIHTQGVRKELARANNLVEDIFENSNARLAILDSTAHFSSANPAFLDHYQISLQDVMSLSPFKPNEIFNVLPLDQDLESLVEKARSGRNFRAKVKVLSGVDYIGHAEVLFFYQKLTREYLLLFESLKTDLKEITEGTSETGDFTDPETGLPQFNYLRSQLETNWDEFKKKESCLLYIDLDDFKELEGQYGKEATSKLLREFGQFLRKFFRTSDLVVRIKDDQFVVLLSQTSLASAETIANNLLQKAKASNQDRALFSMGIAPLSLDDSLEDWIARAYAALKNAKLSGKGRFEVQKASDLEIEV